MTSWMTLRPVRLVFHHGPRESFGNSDKPKSIERKKKPEGVPIDTEKKEHLSLSEEREILRRPYENVRTFEQNPEKKASREHINDFFARKTDDIGQIWRFLSVPRKMQYHLIQKPNEDVKRRQFLFQHRSEILANYQLDIQAYAKMSDIKKVPLLALPAAKATNELQIDRPVFFLGQEHVAQDALFKSAKVNTISNADDPVKALAAFESQIGKRSAEELKGAPVVINFRPDMFVSSLSLQQMTDATMMLLKKINEKGMKAVVITPLPISHPDYSKLGGKFELRGTRAMKEAETIRKQYLDFLAKAFQGGLIGSMVDAASAMKKQLRDESGKLQLIYYKDPNDLSKGLNEEGMRRIAAGIVDGIHFADGNHTGRTNAGAEFHYFGAGHEYGDAEIAAKNAGHGKTIELIPGYEKRQSIAKLPKDSKRALWRVAYLHMCADLGLVQLDEKMVKHEVDIAETVIAGIQDPKQREFARVEFMRQKASIYYMYAWQALRKGDFDGAQKRIVEAEQKNRDFLAWQKSPMLAVRLNRLKRLVASRTKVGNAMAKERVHAGAPIPLEAYEKDQDHHH